MSKSLQNITIQVNPVSTAGTAPSWATAISVGQWAALSQTNTVKSLAPDPTGAQSYSGNSGQKAVITSWNSGALAANIGTYGTYYIWGGGHHDYFGNEVYGFDLGTLTWSRLSEPYPNASDSLVTASGWYPAHTGQPNGSPGVPHTYAQFEYDPDLKCLITLRCQVNTSPSVIPKVGLFPLTGSSLTAWQWQEGSQYTASGNPITSDGWMTRDSNRGLLLTHGGSGSSSSVLASLDPTVGEAGSYGLWTRLGAKSSGSGQVAAYDPQQDILVLYTPDTGVVRALNCAALTGSLQSLAVENPQILSRKCGFQYSPTLNAFVAWDTGGNVYQLRKSVNGDYLSGTWTWSLLTASGNTVSPAKASNGTFGRFRIATYSNAEVAIVINAVDQQPYAFRIV